MQPSLREWLPGDKDERYGQARGDELRTRKGRRRWLADAKRALDAEPSDPPQAASDSADGPPSKPLRSL